MNSIKHFGVASQPKLKIKIKCTSASSCTFTVQEQPVRRILGDVCFLVNQPPKPSFQADYQRGKALGAYTCGLGLLLVAGGVTRLEIPIWTFPIQTTRARVKLEFSLFAELGDGNCGDRVDTIWGCIRTSMQFLGKKKEEEKNTMISTIL